MCRPQMPVSAPVREPTRFPVWPQCDPSAAVWTKLVVRQGLPDPDFPLVTEVSVAFLAQYSDGEMQAELIV